MEQENKQPDESLAETSMKAESSGVKTPKSLKTKSKIVKSNVKKIVQAKKAGSNVKNKTVLRKNDEGSTVGHQNNEELITREYNQQKIATNDEPIEKSGELQANQEKIGVSPQSKQKQRKGKLDAVAVTNKESKEKCKSTEKRTQKKESDESEKNEKGKEKSDTTEKKLGGLIFMCNTKTKPDCFGYRVMGVSMAKKDLVMGVKPGLKLFLYDFDLRVMYGIYKASSSGGMKLEPKAFGGSFPVQVRFDVHKDCYPLPENIFRNAIRENYYERNKFNVELNVKQARKLMELFQPASVYSTALPIHTPPLVVADTRDRQVYNGVKDSRLYSERERYRDQHDVHLELTSTRKEAPPPPGLYISEKEYRAYGLKGAQNHPSSSLNPYQIDHGRDYRPRHSDTGYRDTIPMHREVVRTDHLYSTDMGIRRELASSTVPPATTNPSFASATLDPYRGDPNLPHFRREGYLRESEPLPRTEIDRADRSYSTYAANALSDYNRTQHYQDTTSAAAPPPVSSRYSFAGPSFSFR